MIKLVRVDHRLVHGQVAVSWAPSLGIDCILVASDAVVQDDTWKTMLKLGKPSGCKLVIKSIEDAAKAINSGVTDRYKLLVVVQSISEVKKLADICPSITSVNLGNTKQSATTKQISKQVFIEPEDADALKELGSRGIECEIRSVATESKQDALSLL